MGRQTFKKQITSPEILAQINKDNLKLCQIYLRDKQRKCSDDTIKQYQSALNIFFCWNIIENENKFYPQIKKIEISMFFDYLLNELRVNGKRFAFFKSVLSGLSDCVIKYYDEDERCKTFRNFISAIIENVPKNEAREKSIVDDAELNRLFMILDQQKRTQEACLLALACYSGMRISELVQTRVDWFDENRLAYDGLFYKTPKMRTKGAGKQGKVIDRLILHDLFKPYLQKWILDREKILNNKGIEDHGKLFINTKGEPASQSVIRNIMTKWEPILNMPVYPHMWRHLFVSICKRKYKCSDEFIKTIVRWSSIDLVGVYNDNNADDVEWEEINNIKQVLCEEKSLSN